MKKVINIGVYDRNLDLFEGQYKIKNGASFNSYLLLSNEIAVIDTVDYHYASEWLENIKKELSDYNIKYLIIQHMEPDHSGSIELFLKTYPNVIVVGTKQIKKMINNFFPNLLLPNFLEVKEGEQLSLGMITLQFIAAPFVHWPEVMMTYAIELKSLFSADGFGRFGSWDKTENWLTEARRYYIGIVGKYGKNVQNVLKKASSIEIEKIYPLHGPTLDENIEYYISMYNKWSTYTPEMDGIVIACSSVYQNTYRACEYLKTKLISLGYKNVLLYDLARSDKHEVIAQAFAKSKLVLGSITYNASIFPDMENFIIGLKERNYQNRIVGIIENGSWAPVASKIIKEKMNDLNDITFTNTVTILSSMTNENIKSLDELALELIK